MWFIANSVGVVLLTNLTASDDEAAARMTPVVCRNTLLVTAVAAEQRVERAFVDLNAMASQRLAERIAVLLGPQLRQDGDDQASAPELQPQVFEECIVHRQYRVADSVLHIVCATQYTKSRSFLMPEAGSP